MARIARRDAPGAVHHVLLRGIERRAIFRCDRDRRDFLARLDRLVPETGTACFAWALMPNHVHLVLRTGQRPLSELMRRLNTGYARSFNLRHRRSGILFQNRFRSILVEDDAYLRTLVRYVHGNPLEAGLVESLSALAGYPWAGHAGLLGRHERGFHGVDEVLGWFGRDRGEARAALLAWMRAEPEGEGHFELGAGAAADLAGELRCAHALAPDDAWRRADAALADVHARKLRAAGWTLDVLIRWVCSQRRVEPVRVCAGGRRPEESRARAVIGYFATLELGYTLVETSRRLGVGPGPMSRSVRRGAALVAEACSRLPTAPPPG